MALNSKTELPCALEALDDYAYFKPFEDKATGEVGIRLSLLALQIQHDFAEPLKGDVSVVLLLATYWLDAYNTLYQEVFSQLPNTPENVNVIANDFKNEWPDTPEQLMQYWSTTLEVDHLWDVAGEALRVGYPEMYQKTLEGVARRWEQFALAHLPAEMCSDYADNQVWPTFRYLTESVASAETINFLHVLKQTLQAWMQHEFGEKLPEDVLNGMCLKYQKYLILELLAESLLLMDQELAALTERKNTSVLQLRGMSLQRMRVVSEK